MNFKKNKLVINEKNIPFLTAVFVFISIYLLGLLINKNFNNISVILNLFHDNSVIGIIAVGMTFVILSGGIDLSVGALAGLISIYVAKMIEIHHIHPAIAFLSALLIGAFFGFAMGSIIHFLKKPPFLVTLVGMFLARGAAYMISLGSITINNSIYFKVQALHIVLPGIAKINFISILFVLIVLIGILISHFTKFGQNVYSIGSNEESAYLMGLPVGFTKISVYTINSMLCALAGIVYSLYTQSGFANACNTLELDVIASVVIGGTLLTGGIGLIEGTLVGVLILGLIQTFITFQGQLSSWWIKMIIGFLLCIFILLQRYISKKIYLNVDEN